MPLSASTLKSALQASLESYPATAVVAGQAWADAIAAYIAGGSSCQAVPPTSASIDAGKAALAASIAAALSSGSAASAAAGLSAAVALFFQGLLFVGVTPGSVAAVGGAAALQAGMQVAFATFWPTMADAAQEFATQIDLCAKTVMVQHAAPAACASFLL